MGPGSRGQKLPTHGVKVRKMITISFRIQIIKSIISILIGVINLAKIIKMRMKTKIKIIEAIESVVMKIEMMTTESERVDESNKIGVTRYRCFGIL